jgi:uncharacterized membrane protein YciS (DUF1049 family)
MTWLKKWIKFLFLMALAVIVFIAGLAFFTANHPNPVTVKYMLGEVSTHLVWVVFYAFFAGVLLTVVILGIPYYITRVDLQNLRQELKSLKKSGQGVR